MNHLYTFAPLIVLEKEQQKRAEAESKIKVIEEQIAALKNNLIKNRPNWLGKSC